MSNVPEILNSLAEKVGTPEVPASERQMARALGVSHEAVNQWRKGNFSPDLRLLDRNIAHLTHGLEALRQMRAVVVAPPVVEPEPADEVPAGVS